MAFSFHAGAGLTPFLSRLAAEMTYYSRSKPFKDFRLQMQTHALSTNLKSAIFLGGADGIRTHCLFNAIEALSQLSYSPK